MMRKENSHYEEVDNCDRDCRVGDVEGPPAGYPQKTDIEEVDIEEINNLAVVDAINDVSYSSCGDQSQWPGDSRSSSVAIDIVDNERQ